MSNNKANIYDIDWKNTDKAIKTLKQIIQSEEEKNTLLNPYQNFTITTKYKNYNIYDSTYSYSHKRLSTSTQQSSDFIPKVNLNTHIPEYQKYIGKSYILQRYPYQPHTSTQFVNYVKAGEKGNEILGGLVKNGPYKGQLLFTESKNFTGTVIIPEYMKTSNTNITTVYPEESITFLNGKIQEIHYAKPSRLKIHRAHLKEERNNSFQRDKAIIHTFIINNAKSHNQEIFFLDNPNKQISSTKLSPKYIISPDRQLIQSIEEQQKTFIDKIPIINKLFKSYYNNRISKAFSSEKLAISFTESPEKFHIALYTQNRNSKPMKIDLNNLYIYNNNFYNKIEQAVHSSSHHVSININKQNNTNQNMLGNNPLNTQTTKSANDEIPIIDNISKIIIGLAPTFGIIGLATTTFTTQGIILPVLDSIFGITILTSKQLIPDSFQMTIEGTKNLIKLTYAPENSKQYREQDTSRNLAKNQTFNEIHLKKDHNFDNKVNQKPKYFTNSVLESSKQTSDRSI